MFHLFLTLAYIIPNIYMYFRIKSLFITKGYKLSYTLVYLLIAAIYPLFGRDDYQDVNILFQGLTTLAAYILPFCLYLFLSVMVFDLFLLVNKIIKIITPETQTRFSFRFYTLLSMIVLSVLVVAGGAINLNTIRISKYEIEVPRKHSRIDHLRIAFVADFHIQQNTSLEFVEQFSRKVNALKPDILLYGGDIVEGNHENETTEAIEGILRKIATKYGCYGVVGNHEYYGRQGQGTFFGRAGITLLCDSIVKIDSSFYLAGRNDEHSRQRQTIDALLKNSADDLPIILMDHRPTELQEVSQTKTNVQFSGHTHNGQLFPLNYIIHNIYELGWGYKKIRNTHFFVTSGLRLWGPPVKTAGKSEIMLVDIYFNSNAPKSGADPLKGNPIP